MDLPAPSVDKKPMKPVRLAQSMMHSKKNPAQHRPWASRQESLILVRSALRVLGVSSEPCPPDEVCLPSLVVALIVTSLSKSGLMAVSLDAMSNHY